MMAVKQFAHERHPTKWITKKRVGALAHPLFFVRVFREFRVFRGGIPRPYSAA
jgi:hypothetical protein